MNCWFIHTTKLYCFPIYEPTGNSIDLIDNKPIFRPYNSDKGGNMEIGGEYIPDMRLYPELVDGVKKLYGKFGSNDVDQETVAQLMGHKSASSSQWRVVRLRCLKDYRLVEGRGKIRVTDVGKRLTQGDSKEQIDALVESVTSISFWNKLFEKYTKIGKPLPTDNFWMDLRQIIGEDKLSPDEAKSKAEKVRKAFLEDVMYYKPIERPEKEVSPTPTPEPQTQFGKSVSMVPENFARLETEDFVVQVRKDAEAIEFAESQIKSWFAHVRKKLGKEAKTKD